MCSNRWVFGLVFCVMAALAAPVYAAEITWSTEIRESLQQSKESGRPVMVDIWAVWCKPCKELDETTYRDATVVEAAARWVPLKVDADLHETFTQTYNVEAFPTILFLDGDGDEISRLAGLVDARRLLEVMGAIESGYGDYVEARRRVPAPDAVLAVSDYFSRVENPSGAVEVLKRAVKSARKGADAAVRGRLEVRLGEAYLQAADAKAAAKVFDGIVQSGATEEVRGRALKGLVLAQRQRGQQDEATTNLQRLQDEFPALAAGVADAN